MMATDGKGSFRVCIDRGEFIILIVIILLAVLGVYGFFQLPSDTEKASARKEKLQDFGLLGERPLSKIENFGAVQGAVSGDFFLGMGSVDSSLGSEMKIQFYWSPRPNNIVATTLPYSKLRFVVDNDKDGPTVEFVFGQHWPEHRSSYSLNPNELIMSHHLQVAVVRISEEDIKKEIYLPEI